MLKRLVWTALWTGFTGFFAVVFYFRYWVFRDLFNDNGFYWDGVENHTDSAFVWCLPLGLFFLLLCVSLLRTWRQWSRH